MVRTQLRSRGISDERVLAAMRQVPRHLFVPLQHRSAAYTDQALPIGYGQTISQPYIVALMTSALSPGPGLRALEVGGGSGYQAAVLAACGMEVFSVERIPELHAMARYNLERSEMGRHVRLRLGDGSEGWPEEAPFDRILIAAAAPEIPAALRDQLRTGGVLVAPLGDSYLQTLYRCTKREDGTLTQEPLEEVRFVPFVTGPDRTSDR
ncbi:MAG: protein-L-isoaspartate(D-aspartate) O-methyltransferase [Gemmatimonadota bacterium]